jgi:hypothetical protein
MLSAAFIVKRLLENDDDDIGRYIDAAAHQLRYGAKMLATQPTSADPVTYTHFDCWSDTGDDEDDGGEVWNWDSDQAVAQVGVLCDEWVTIPGVDADKIRQIQRNYLALGIEGPADYGCPGQADAFNEFAKVFIEAGYSVYLSDSMFEVYDPEELSEEDNVSDDEL